ncbi:MAG: hypothetical protein NTW49_10875 [Bacteroidia bacterium]|nr:hypothetical protein [Bacteroidia bacterium]
MKTIYIISAMVLAFLVWPGFSASGQDKEKTEKHSPILAFTYLKNPDGSKTLSATASFIINRQIFPLSYCKLKFYCGEQELGILTSDKQGSAKLIIQPAVKLPKDEKGTLLFRNVYEGCDSVEKTESSISVRDLNLLLKFSEKDSIKSISLHAFELGEKGDTLPVNELPVNFMIKRMFTNLKIGDGTTDPKGYCSMDFKGVFPGDSLGNIFLLARVDDNDDYGNVESGEIKKWGVPTNPVSPFVKRELWTEIAPIWMIVTLIIMLTGVWAHYLYVVFNISRIRREGKKIEKLKEISQVEKLEAV